MNLYKIHFTADGEERYDFVTELTESRAIQRFKKVQENKAIVLVELVQENAPATKEQEREAVKKIAAILGTLGPNSYVATALEGCLELAEQKLEGPLRERMGNHPPPPRGH